MKKRASAICAAGLLAAGLMTAQEEKEAAAKGDAAKGKEAFEQCAVCHNVDTDEKKMGPSLKGLFKKEKLTNKNDVNEKNVRAVIDAGGNGMPAYADMLTDEDKDNLIAYLKTL
ncbi:MAG: c-type cytochrome [Bryobacteraceae bacterium]